MKLLYKLFLMFISVFALAEITSAQSVTTSIDSAQCLIGDHLHLKIKTTYPNTTYIASPVIIDTLIKPFEVVEKLKTDTLLIGSEVNIIQNYTIICFELGKQHFPQLPWSYQNQNFYTDSIGVMINAVKLDSPAVPRAIKGPVQIPLTLSEMVPYFLWVILLAILVIAGVWAYYKYIKKEKLIDDEKPIEPPHIIALRKLKDTEDAKLWQQEKVKQYYIEVSDALREYIEKRFSINALEQTTDELMTSLKKSKVNANNRAKIERILLLADLAKFAKTQPIASENTESMLLAVDFVEATKQNTDLEKGGKAELSKKMYNSNEYRLQGNFMKQFTIYLIIGTALSLIVIPFVFMSIIYLLQWGAAIIFVTNYSFYLILIYMLVTIIGAFIIYTIVKNKRESYKLLFSPNAVIVRRKGEKDVFIMYEHIKSIVENAKGEIKVFTADPKTFLLISPFISKQKEVKERLAGIMPVEFL
jgi:ribosome-associated translation inhibitor RaiA